VQPTDRAWLVGADPQNLAIGGASLHCVPVRAAGLAASIARGRVVRPWVAGSAPSIGEQVISLGSESVLQLVREGMKAVCGPGGTARRHADELQRLRVAAKTGTADHTGPGGFEVHEAWFVGFAPADDPRLAFAVVLPNARADQPGLKGVEGADGAPYAVRALEICADAMEIRWW
jgi:cell division protein FtsI/penicillin-binding protein 2